MIGIDLGTTNSVVAYVNDDGKPTAIPNQQGKRIIPSVIYFGAGEPLVGEEAKAEQALGAREIAAFFKRNMGEAHFELFFNERNYTPTDLSALILKHLKDIAEEHLQKPVSNAVITVPAYFNNMQKEATIAAGKQAGLNVLSIINEPTAAAFAYGLRPTAEQQTVLVYDLGGGTFDVSIIQISTAEQRVLAVDGDHHLGGKDWDDRIFNYLVMQFNDEFGFEPAGEDFNELMVKAEKAKKALTSREWVDVTVQAQGERNRYRVTRELFEELTADLMSRTQLLTEQVLQAAGLGWGDLSLVLLVGGSTRMPMVTSYVEQMSGQPVLKNINPDEAVALGAAIKATIEMKDSLPKDKPIFGLASRAKPIDVVSHSLGMIAINEAGDRYINQVIIKKNSPFPTEVSQSFTLRVSRQRENQWEVFMTQGESDKPNECAYLGKYLFGNIPFVEGGTATLDITYAYNHDGVVRVSAMERTTGQSLPLSIEELPYDVPERFMQPPVQEEVMVQQPLIVYLAFDLSGSMSGTPLKEAQKAAHAFVAQCGLDNSSIGIIGFADRVETTLEACRSKTDISRAIDNLPNVNLGCCNDAHPFDEIHRLLQATQSQRSLWQRLWSGEEIEPRRYALVLADGVWSNQNRAIERAKRCHAEGIDIIGIGFGGADQAFLKAITSADQESVFTQKEMLSEAFSSIAQVLNEGSQGLMR